MSAARLVFGLLAISTALVAIAIPLVVGRLRRRTGFAFGALGADRVVASDVGSGPSLLLRDDNLGICGKPDYLLDMTRGGERILVPLEVKPSRRIQRLYDSDRVQIGAYLIALRATVDERASRIGYVRYQDRTFEVALTPDLESEVRRIVAEIRRGRTADVIHRSHRIPARCRACPVRHACDEALDG